MSARWQNYVSSHIVCNGALGRIRTPDPLIRSQVLYPAELPERGEGDLASWAGGRKSEKRKNWETS